MSAFIGSIFKSNVLKNAGLILLGSGATSCAYKLNDSDAFYKTMTMYADHPVAGVAGSNSERTFIAVKPDGVQRGLVGDIVQRFEKRGYKLVAIKSIVPPKALAESHYEDLKQKPFFKGLVDYMTNGEKVITAGPDVIKQGRSMIGATNPQASTPGSIRGDLCLVVGRNIVHGSDSHESATKEIGLWFKPTELIDWKQTMSKWLLEGN